MTLCEGNLIRADDLQLPDDGTETALDDIGGPLDSVLGTVEKEAILRALEQTRYNKTAAAKLLGITFRALRYRLKKLGLE
jgi:two-component system response regulator PilR (NtrC family)